MKKEPHKESPAQNGNNEIILSPRELKSWRALQHKWYLSGVHLLSVASEETFPKTWFWHIREDRYKVIFKQKKAGNFLSRISVKSEIGANYDLGKIFDPNAKELKIATWATFDVNIHPACLFVPATDIRHIHKPWFKYYIQQLSDQYLHFPFAPFLHKLKLEHKKYSEVSLAGVALWTYFIQYFRYLSDAIERDAGLLQSLDKFPRIKMGFKSFDEMIPIIQAIDILYDYSLNAFLNRKDFTDIEQKIKRSHPSVRVFWNKIERSIDLHLTKHFGARKKEKYIPRRAYISKRKAITLPQMGKLFYALEAESKNHAILKELIENTSRKSFIFKLPRYLRIQYEKEIDHSSGQWLEQNISRKNILERINQIAERKKELPKLYFIEKEIREESENKISHYDQESLSRLWNQYTKHLEVPTQKELKEVAFQNYKQHVFDKLNQQMAPFIHFRKKDERFIPQWTIINSNYTDYHFEQFISDRQKEEKETERLEKQLNLLRALQKEFNILQLEKSTKNFAFPELQEKWTDALKQHSAKLKAAYQYRVNRMLEFGIIEHENEADDIKIIFLEEMLKIEEEVSEYVQYVKEAFRTSLPVRSTVEFNEFRHSIDGIEFDPITIMDYPKWIRGEVMKPLKRNMDTTEIIQVNTILMDASGSMDHPKMRNLYKLIYLIVLGLEDRKSFDAFHFFANEFMETSKFTDRFTNRTMLYNILKQISGLLVGEVRYRGRGGTNLSDGIIQSHKRNELFLADLRGKYPDKYFVSSIFVITDGEPSLGILEPELINEKIQYLRLQNETILKGIYVGSKRAGGSFMEEIFGKDEFISTSNFEEAIQTFVSFVTSNYTEQRKRFKQNLKKNKAH